ncbi:putative G protein-coupled receptor-like, partial [Homarus americanus]
VMAETTVNMYHNNTTVQQQHQEDAAAAHLAIVNDVAYRYLMPIFITAGILTNLLNVVMLGRMRHHQQQRQAQATTFCYLMWLASLTCSPQLPSSPPLSTSTPDKCQCVHRGGALRGPLHRRVPSPTLPGCERPPSGSHPHHSVPLGACTDLHPTQLLPGGSVRRRGVGWTYERGGDGHPWAWHAWEVVVELCHRMAPAILLVLLNCSIIYTFKKVTARRKNIVTKTTPSTTHPAMPARRVRRRQESAGAATNLPAGHHRGHLPAHQPARHRPSSNRHRWRHPWLLLLEVYRAAYNCLEVLSFSLNFVLAAGGGEGGAATLCGLVVNTVPSQSCFISENNTKNTDSTE